METFEQLSLQFEHSTIAQKLKLLHEATAAELLWELASQDTSIYVRAQVARSCPVTEVIERAYNDSHFLVRTAALVNPHAPVWLLALALKHPSAEVRKHAVAAQHLSVELLTLALQDTAPVVQTAAQQRQATGLATNFSMSKPCNGA